MYHVNISLKTQTSIYFQKFVSEKSIQHSHPPISIKANCFDLRKQTKLTLDFIRY